MYYDQADFDVRCEWGEAGVRAVAPGSDVVIIVDVLSFSTAVDVATARGATIYPYRFGDESAKEFAEKCGAQLAEKRGAGRWSLSPGSLAEISAGTRLVLPSPNGAALSILAGKAATLTGCLRNAQAVATHASKLGRKIAVIPAGERWEDNSLRPAVEDWIGVGAICSSLKGIASPEARAATVAFEAAISDLLQALNQASSGKELIERGWMEDIRWAADLNCSRCVPQLVEGAYINVGAR